MNGCAFADLDAVAAAVFGGVQRAIRSIEPHDRVLEGRVEIRQANAQADAQVWDLRMPIVTEGFA